MAEAFTAVVVGCGAVGSGYDADRVGRPPLSHAGAYSAHPATELLAGVDSDPEARRRFEARWNVPCHEDLSAALSQHRPALVSVCTPAESHADLVDKAALAGAKGIWVEKPLAPSDEVGIEVVESAKRASAALQVNFLRRFDPLHRRVAKQLASPGSALVHADLRYSGTLSNFGSHAIDLFRWFAGEVASVRAVPGNEDEPILFLRSESGATASLYRVRAGTTEIFEAYLFTNGGLMTLTGLGEDLSRWEPTPSELFRGTTRIGSPHIDPDDGLANAMVEGVESLVSHLISGTPLLCDGADGLAALAVDQAAAESLRTGEPVRPG